MTAHNFNSAKVTHRAAGDDRNAFPAPNSNTVGRSGCQGGGFQGSAAIRAEQLPVTPQNIPAAGSSPSPVGRAGVNLSDASPIIQERRDYLTDTPRICFIDQNRSGIAKAFLFFPVFHDGVLANA